MGEATEGGKKGRGMRRRQAWGSIGTECQPDVKMKEGGRRGTGKTDGDDCAS